nr:MAG TPA: hypothetical protein [Caudoviricetes sp.]
MVTVEISINITSPLTASSSYYVSGFPTGVSDVAASCHFHGATNYCYMTADGTIVFNPSINLNAASLLISCTYRTNA